MVKKPSTFFTLFKMRLRSFRKGWAQFLSVIAIGAIAVTLFVGLTANAESFEKRVNSVYESGNLSSLWVTVSRYDEEDKRAIEGFLEEGDAIEERLYAPIEISNRSSYVAISHELPTISKPFSVRSEVENGESDGDFFLLDKGMEKSGSSSLLNEFSLGEKVTLFMDVSSYAIADYAKLLAPYVKDGGTNIFLSNKLSLDVRITGFMDYPENITKSNYNPSVALLGDKTFKEAFFSLLEDNYDETGQSLVLTALNYVLGFHDKDAVYYTEGNQYLIALKDASKAGSVKKRIVDYFSSSRANASLVRAMSRSEMPFYITLNNDVTQARQFTFVFPFVFFLVAVLVILTTLSQHILQERTQIGTLKALGLTKGQIYWHYSSLTLLLVGLGTLLGEIIGPIIVPKILGNKYAIFYSLPPLTYHFPILYGILTALVFLSLSVFITILVCHKEVSLKPVDSMRPKKPSTMLKTMKGEGKANVFALSLKMAFRNISLNFGKSIMVVFGVLGCTALLLCGFGIEDTVYHGIDSDIATLRHFDITTTFSTNRNYADASKDILSIEGVDSVEPIASASSTIYCVGGGETNSRVYVIPSPSQCYKITFDKNEIAVSQKVARITGASKGDTIRFYFAGEEFKAKVGMIYDAFATHGIMIHDDANVFKEAGIHSFAYSGAQVYLKSGYSPQIVNEKIKSLSYVLSSQTLAEWQQYINDVMGGVIAMTNAVKVFAILLALVVLYNLSLMNFKERTRDIATLKVLGFSRFEIALSLLFETMSLTFIGVLLGMMLGYPFLELVLGTNIVEIVEYLYFIKPLSYLYSFLLSFIVAFLVNLFFSFRTRAIPMVESLKSVE